VEDSNATNSPRHPYNMAQMKPLITSQGGLLSSGRPDYYS